MHCFDRPEQGWIPVYFLCATREVVWQGQVGPEIAQSMSACPKAGCIEQYWLPYNGANNLKVPNSYVWIFMGLHCGVLKQECWWECGLQQLQRSAKVHQRVKGR